MLASNLARVGAAWLGRDSIRVKYSKYEPMHAVVYAVVEDAPVDELADWEELELLEEFETEKFDCDELAELEKEERPIDDWTTFTRFALLAASCGGSMDLIWKYETGALKQTSVNKMYRVKPLPLK